MVSSSEFVTLARNTNQARGIAQFALDFFGPAGTGGEPDQSVLDRVTLFNTDATIAGVAALGLRENAPTVLRREALGYRVYDGVEGATVFGSSILLHPEKAILANCAAVREYDTNGTVFGYNPALGPGHRAGEFGHNDFYAVPVAAAQMKQRDGSFALLGMLLLDEIRGRLAEVFSLKDCKVDHVLHGAIACAATYGAMMGATVDQIESAIGMVIAHFVPFRAIRAGHQLSDSKGASAAMSAEAAILCVKRSMDGFQGPKDIFRNPEAIFRLFAGPGQLFQKVGAGSANVARLDESPFDLVLTRAGSNFAVMGMHFKLGLYEHQSASALQALIKVFCQHPELLQNPSRIERLVITAYQPAFGIIGDPAKRDPHNRQSADHSMVYIVARMLRKALELRKIGWIETMLLPSDYDDAALRDQLTRDLMARIEFVHGGEEYDRRYPEGIPTSLQVFVAGSAAPHDSGLIMFPGGHARNAESKDPVDVATVLDRKFHSLATQGVTDAHSLILRLQAIGAATAEQIAEVNNFPLVCDAE